MESRMTGIVLAAGDASALSASVCKRSVEMA
jgi:hypothetical protein